MVGQAMRVVHQQQPRIPRRGPVDNLGSRNEFVVPTMDDRRRHARCIQSRRRPHADRWRHQEQAAYRYFKRDPCGNPRPQARPGQHEWATGSGVSRDLQQTLQARGHVAQVADVMPRIEIAVVGAFMGPAQALGHVRKRGDLGRVRPAFETVGKNAMSLHAAPFDDAASEPRAPWARSDWVGCVDMGEC